MEGQQAVYALIDEHERALRHLLGMMSCWREETLAKKVDHKTTVNDVLDHLTTSIHIYFEWLQEKLGTDDDPVTSPLSPDLWREKQVCSLEEWKWMVTSFLSYCRLIAIYIKDNDLGKAYPAPWNEKEVYMIEQMLEHAIVHVWRHCRQLERLGL